MQCVFSHAILSLEAGMECGMSPAKSKVTQAAWSVAVADSTPEQTQPKPYEDLRLVWGKSSHDGKPKYIFELGEDENGLSCDCVCYSCGNPLAAVNAGKLIFVRQPHFRHHKGSQKSDCIYHAARVAALRFLLDQDALQLPRRRISATSIGVSGKEYVASIEVLPELVKISSYVESYENDMVKALLTLDDGREIAIKLVANIGVKNDDDGDSLISSIELMVSDPSIASMSLEELKNHISIIIDDAKWCKHWDDQVRKEEAVKLALKQAENALDWLDIIDSLPSDCDRFLKQETILHIKAKEILQERKTIVLPNIFMQFTETALSGKNITVERYIKPQEIKLCNVVLEKSIGNIRPDVVADIDGVSILVSEKLLIEITVTNHIVGERLEKIKKHNIPTIEIDISLMGGEISVDDFSEFIINSTQGKSWIHHPMMGEIEGELLSELNDAVEVENFEFNKKNEEERLLKIANDAREEERIERERLDIERKIKLEEKIEENRKKEQEIILAILKNLDLEEISRMYLESIKNYSNLLNLDEKMPSSEFKLETQKKIAYIEDIASELINRGFPSANNEELFRSTGSIISVLLSIKSGSPVGYKFETVWQVINSLTCQNSERATQWHTLFLIALKTYPKELNDKQLDIVSVWRKKVTTSIRAGNLPYARSERHDKLLSLLFPEMAGALITNFGKRKHVTKPKNVEKFAKKDELSSENNIFTVKSINGDRFYSSVLYRLECISKNKRFNLRTKDMLGPAWEIIAEIIHERPSETEWLILYIHAIEEYKPTINESRINVYQDWKNKTLANTELQKLHIKVIEYYGDIISEKFPRIKFK